MEEASEILNEVLDKVAEEQKYDNCEKTIKPICSGGANYTSYLYQATLSSPGKDDLKLFIKIAAVGKKMRDLTPIRIFEIEDFFYTKLLKIYQELEEKHQIPSEHRLVTPKYYGGSNEIYREALVLEDLTSKGYQAFDRFKSVDWNYAAKSVQNLSKLHALSIAWSVEDPDEFNKTESLRTDDSFNVMFDYIKNIINRAVSIAKPENKERLSKFISKNTSVADFLGFFKPLRRPVLAHGDYRPSNLVHRVHDKGEVDIISVDYQTVQLGNPIVDLIYFIFNGSDKTFRQNHFKDTIALYYTELCAALRRLHLDPDLIYPREDYDFEVEKVLPFGLVISMFILLIITVQEEDAPKVNKDIAIDNFAFNPNDLYKERVNDIIDDYIAMGIL